jgi:hypothetical protein
MDMEWTIALVTALGGLELLKYLHTRRQSSRVASAKAEVEEFKALREYNEFMQRQLMAREERFEEQTAIVRRLNEEVITLTNELAALRLDHQRLRCERRGCPQREPENGY